MATWFLGKISHNTEDINGNLKTNKEVYLVDAYSYTEAEAQLIRKLQQKVPEFRLEGLTRMKLSEVFIEDNEGTFFKMKVLYITFDERSQKEKMLPHTMIINAENPGLAYEYLSKKLGTFNDYKITDINTTQILDVFPYESAEK
ncbi:DUF4494 domain-containing protein [Flectobacillus major]|uniref:DUF4494 domain-containing protein n=1 Tax=Flectobacillus major TaxID=103 RepID=UPI0004224BD6|nr:DUF4494 domain-containing protein [Flectobacillus major]